MDAEKVIEYMDKLVDEMYELSQHEGIETTNAQFMMKLALHERLDMYGRYLRGE